MGVQGYTSGPNCLRRLRCFATNPEPEILYPKPFSPASSLEDHLNKGFSAPQQCRDPAFCVLLHPTRVQSWPDEQTKPEPQTLNPHAGLKSRLGRWSVSQRPIACSEIRAPQTLSFPREHVGTCPSSETLNAMLGRRSISRGGGPWTPRASRTSCTPLATGTFLGGLFLFDLVRRLLSISVEIMVTTVS